MVTLKFVSRLVTDALVSNAPKTSKHDLLIIDLLLPCFGGEAGPCTMHLMPDI